MRKRIVGALLALAVALLLGFPADTAAQGPQTADALFQFIADRIESLVQDLVTGKISMADAAGEISDLQAIAAAGQFAFASEIAAGGGNLGPAVASLQSFLGTAAQAITSNGPGDLQEAFLVRLASAAQVSSALSAALRGGTASLTPQQSAVLQAAAPGQAAAVRSADYAAPVAMDSIATLFSTRPLASGPMAAVFDANGNLPQALGGVTVTVGGQLAELLYTSPGQVNFIMPMGVAVSQDGMAEVVATGSNGAIATGSVQVLAVAPSIFTLDFSGRGEGAILNGVTFKPGPFAVTTPENGSDDKRTRLAIFLTGVRNAPNTDPANDVTLPGGGKLINVAESVTVTVAGISVPVEYAGRQPTFMGLDQINVILTPELAGRGSVDLVVQAASQVSNTVKVTIQ